MIVHDSDTGNEALVSSIDTRTGIAYAYVLRGPNAGQRVAFVSDTGDMVTGTERDDGRGVWTNH